jgi:hypothetical protein
LGKWKEKSIASLYGERYARSLAARHQAYPRQLTIVDMSNIVRCAGTMKSALINPTSPSTVKQMKGCRPLWSRRPITTHVYNLVIMHQIYLLGKYLHHFYAPENSQYHQLSVELPVLEYAGTIAPYFDASIAQKLPAPFGHPWLRVG